MNPRRAVGSPRRFVARRLRRVTQGRAVVRDLLYVGRIVSDWKHDGASKRLPDSGFAMKPQIASGSMHHVCLIVSRSAGPKIGPRLNW